MITEKEDHTSHRIRQPQKPPIRKLVARNGTKHPFQHLIVRLARQRCIRLRTMHNTRIPMIHNGTPHLPFASRPITSPRIAPSHPFKNTLIIDIVLSESRAILQLQLEKINTSAGIFFWIMASLSAGLDLATTPFFREPRKAGLEWPAPRMVIRQGGVDTPWVTNFECFEV
jgi:hypothetical protein